MFKEMLTNSTDEFLKTSYVRIVNAFVNALLLTTGTGEVAKLLKDIALKQPGSGP